MKLHPKILGLLESKRQDLAQLPTGYAEGLIARMDGIKRKRGVFRKAIARNKGEPIRFICEYKPASPSKGDLPAATVEDTVKAYERGGASAISVLTERHVFKGGLEFLERARKATKLPVMRKDFIIDKIELLEARAFGADAVLLIDGITPRLGEFIAEADALGLDCLVESFDAQGAARCVDAGASIVGVNNRDFGDLSTDLSRAAKAFKDIPEGIVFVAESGVETRADVERYETLDVDALLVGTALMESSQPESKLKELRGQ
ncbi:hypothetical protein AUJ14_05040 [Candidatus Micrarchaeota archaeon CG1_02_55_22]|nr:MAG: hypothetical protein AUJ14_05040 [Candidatus Micrarchaeota archaeon CG1_02_55_22]